MAEDIKNRSDGPDDFANDKDIQRSRNIQAEYKKMIDDCAAIICSRLSLESSACEDPYEFILFNTLADCEIDKAFSSQDSSVQVIFGEYTSSVSAGKVRSSGRDLYMFGLLALQKKYPATYIMRETIKERLVDLFVKADLDFKGQKKFSSSFHVVTQDKEKLSMLLASKDLDALADFPDMELEINDDFCRFRISRKPIDMDQADKFVELTKVVKRVLT